MTQGKQQCAHQGRLAGAEFAFEMDDQSRLQAIGQPLSQTPGRLFVGQQELRGKLAGMQNLNSPVDYSKLACRIKVMGRELGFSAIGIASASVAAAAPRLLRWLEQQRHGEMDYMARHAHLRADPQTLLPGTASVICVALDYLPGPPGQNVTAKAGQAAISHYALGRDYHKVMRQRLQKLVHAVEAEIGSFAYRVFADSAPVMEVELARQAGLGWQGKNALLLGRRGSWRFLGEIYTDLPLPPDAPMRDHCGRCAACLSACPTGALVAPYQVDARRCISYLTIEFAGSIPVELRPLIGNRIYGCDDCQLCCPWNRFARPGDPAFAVRHGLDRASLIELFAWDEAAFLERFAGSAIRRIGFDRWLRNLAVALGNAPPAAESLAALRSRFDHPSALVREHVAWAIARQNVASLP